MAESQGERKLDVAVGSYIAALQHRHVNEGLPTARSTLAKFRQAVDESPGASPETWQAVLEVLPERYIGIRDTPTKGEWAAHLALTLYGVHQRGNSTPMHKTGESFGSAMGKLVRRRESSKSRYDALLTSTHFAGRRQHLRSLVGLLSTEGLPLDYGRLALDLWRLQTAGTKDAVSLSWGRDFYRAFAYQSSSAPTV